MSSLRNRLLIRFVLVAMTPIAIAAVASCVLTSRQLHRTLEERVAGAVHGAKFEIASITEDLHTRAKAVAGEPPLAAAVKARDRQAILSFLERTRLVLDVDAITVVDDEAMVLARSYAITRYGDRIPNRTNVKRILHGQRVVGVARGELGIGFNVALPLHTEAGVVGGLLIEDLLDYQFLTRLKRKFGLDAAVFDNGRLQATTYRETRILRDIDASVRDESGSPDRADAIFEVELDDTEYFAGAIGLLAKTEATPSVLFVGISQQPIDDTIYSLVLLYTSLAVGLLIVAVVICVRFTSSIIRPIAALSQTTAEVAKGDLTRRVKAIVPDEIGQLASAFNAMTEELEKTTTSMERLNAEILERQRAEQALRLEKELSERIIRSSVDGILAFNRECEYIIWNPAMEGLSGVSAAEVLGRCAFDVFPFLTEIGEDYYFHEALKGKTVVARDRSYVIPETDKQGFFEGYYSPLRDDRGEVIGGLAVIREITERKREQEDLRKHHDELAHVTRLSTMGEMATGMAHELNQPLAAIAAYSFAARNLLDASDLDVSELKTTFDSLEGQAIRAGDIVRQLRSYVKKQPSVRAPVQLNTLICEVARFLEPDTRSHEVTLEIQHDETDPVVYGDAVHLQQVLVNLIRNAIDAMEETPVDSRRVVVSTLFREDDEVEVAVCDAGKGIAEEDIERIFDAFNSSKESGMGMGLAISRSIVETQGGRIWVTPNDGAGVTFRFTIPCDEGEDEEVREEGHNVAGQ